MPKFSPLSLGAGDAMLTGNPGDTATKGQIINPAAYSMPVGTNPPFLSTKTIVLGVVLLAAVTAVAYFVIKKMK